MFFAPKEIKTETGESLVYNLHRTMVSKEFTFDAAHHLFNYEGKCKSLHGHTYHLQIAVSGYLDERGMTYDFGDLKNIYKNHLEPYRIWMIAPSRDTMVYIMRRATRGSGSL